MREPFERSFTKWAEALEEWSKGYAYTAPEVLMEEWCAAYSYPDVPSVQKLLIEFWIFGDSFEDYLQDVRKRRQVFRDKPE